MGSQLDISRFLSSLIHGLVFLSGIPSRLQIKSTLHRLSNTSGSRPRSSCRASHAARDSAGVLGRGAKLEGTSRRRTSTHRHLGASMSTCSTDRSAFLTCEPKTSGKATCTEKNWNLGARRSINARDTYPCASATAKPRHGTANLSYCRSIVPAADGSSSSNLM